jgi:hypothetical protein
MTETNNQIIQAREWVLATKHRGYCSTNADLQNCTCGRDKVYELLQLLVNIEVDGHTLNLGDNVWKIEHTLECRLSKGGLINCWFNQIMVAFGSMVHRTYANGKYKMINDDGVLVLNNLEDVSITMRQIKDNPQA